MIKQHPWPTGINTEGLPLEEARIVRATELELKIQMGSSKALEILELLRIPDPEQHLDNVHRQLSDKIQSLDSLVEEDFASFSVKRGSDTELSNVETALGVLWAARAAVRQGRTELAWSFFATACYRLGYAVSTQAAALILFEQDKKRTAQLKGVEERVKGYAPAKKIAMDILIAKKGDRRLDAKKARDLIYDAVSDAIHKAKLTQPTASGLWATLLRWLNNDPQFIEALKD